MFRKKVFFLWLVILFFVGVYQIYSLNVFKGMISEIEDELESYNQEEYVGFYDELKEELLGSDNKEDMEISDEDISDKIGLLIRMKNENDEGLALSDEDLNRLKEQNSEIENSILRIEMLKKKLEEQQRIADFPVYNQFPKYPTGCESVALYLLLKYYQVDVEVEDIVKQLKKGSLPYKVNDKIVGGDPEIEFVGDPRLSYSYGVFNGPIAEVGKKYKDGIVSKVGLDFDKVLAIVEQNCPVMVWVTINLTDPFISATWYAESGREVKWISGEHTMVIFSVDDNRVVVSDPYTGTIRYFPVEVFQKRYNYLGKRAIYYE